MQKVLQRVNTKDSIKTFFLMPFSRVDGLYWQVLRMQNSNKSRGAWLSSPPSKVPVTRPVGQEHLT